MLKDNRIPPFLWLSGLSALCFACGGMESELEPEIASTEQGLSSAIHGFAYVTTNASVPSNYRFNSAGGYVTAVHDGVGQYRVRFGNMGGFGGNAQVVAYGTSTARCKISSVNGIFPWLPLEIVVRCHNPNGNLMDSAFVAQYGKQTSGDNGVGAYLWSDQTSPTGCYTPNPLYQWNSTGGAIDVCKTSTGQYDVNLDGLNDWGGTVQVTAFGADPSHCKVRSWSVVGTSQQIRVRCFDTAGNPADTSFNLNYLADENVSIDDYGAYAWAGLADIETSATYTPSTYYSYNSGPWVFNGGYGDITAGRYGLGRYFLRHTYMSPKDSAVHITAYGSGASYCKVERWITSGSGVEVQTRCFDAQGSAQNSAYVETYTTSLSRQILN